MPFEFKRRKNRDNVNLNVITAFSVASELTGLASQAKMNPQNSLLSYQGRAVYHHIIFIQLFIVATISQHMSHSFNITPIVTGC